MKRFSITLLAVAGFLATAPAAHAATAAQAERAVIREAKMAHYTIGVSADCYRAGRTSFSCAWDGYGYSGHGRCRGTAKVRFSGRYADVDLRTYSFCT